jgi:DUF971 family protein
MLHVKTVSNHRQSGTLEILWSDGKKQRFPHAFLRLQCQCAHCKSHRLQGKILDAVSPQLRVTEILAVGAYGVQLIFSDGHDRGIYPWIYLRDLTPP